MEQNKSVSSYPFLKYRKYIITPMDCGLLQNHPDPSLSTNRNSQPQPHILRDSTNLIRPEASREKNQTKTNDIQKEKKISPKKNRERIIELEETPNSGHYYKKLGNQCFNKGLYSSALEHYTKAIETNDTESVFYSNRARCYKRLGDLKKAYEDAKMAIELDDKNTKAYLLCGQILAESSKNEPGLDLLNKALNKIVKALDLCISQDEKEFERDIKDNLLKLRKLIWFKQENKRKEKTADTLEYIKGLIDQDLSLEDNTTKEQKYQEVLNFTKDTSRELPDYLCCKITMEMFEDPAIAPSGISYEREALEKHIRSGKEFDPTTRERMNIDLIHSNKTLQQAKDVFLKENPWAYEFNEDEDNFDIKF